MSRADPIELPVSASPATSPAAPSTKNFRTLLAVVASDAAFFALFYLFVWLVIDPRLIYHRQSPTFILDERFFSRFLNYPGGLTDYLAALLCQSYVSGPAGAAVITVVAWLVCVAGSSFLKGVVGASIPWARLIPGAILLVLHSRYEYPLAGSLALLFSLALMNLQVRVFPRSTAGRLGTFLLLTVVLYFAAGSAYLLFGITLAALELLRRQQSRTAALYLLWTMSVPYLAARYFFDVRAADIYACLLPANTDFLTSACSLVLYGFFIAAVLLFCSSAWTSRAPSEAACSPPGSELPAPRVRRRAWMHLGRVVLPVAAVAGVWALTFDHHEKSLLRIDRFARSRQWPQVLQEAGRLPAGRYLLTTCWDVNRALFHTGRLLDDMFAYPQNMGVTEDAASTLMCSTHPEATDRIDPRAKTVLGEIFLELGRVGEAEFEANEGLAFFGDEPPLIERLFLVHLVKGETTVAYTFATALSRHLLWRESARECRRLLDAEPPPSPDVRLQKIRAVMIHKENVGALGVVTMLQELLDRNPQNRMAAEYLVAHHLLYRQVDEVIADLHRLDGFNGPHLPRHCEEAVLLQTRGSPADLPELGGRQIRPEARIRYKGFMEVFDRHRENVDAAGKALAPDYHDTYYFYYTFGGQNASTRAVRRTIR